MDEQRERVEPMPDRQDLWRWASGMMMGTGVAYRSGTMPNPILHLLAGDQRRTWCGYGKAHAGFVPTGWRPCPKCMTLAREMWRDLADEGDYEAVTREGRPSVYAVPGMRPEPAVVGHDVPAERPPWATGDMPNLASYVESELAVAGAISTLPPFSAYHPAWALPHARIALEGLSKWEPTDG